MGYDRDFIDRSGRIVDGQTQQDQARHAANSLRVIGMAQFTTYGYGQLQSGRPELVILLSSALVYVLLEAVSLIMLGKAS